MTTLAYMHKMIFGPGNWPRTAHNHNDMDAIFTIADVEMDSDFKMRYAFNTMQAGYKLPRADAMRAFKEGVKQSMKINNWGAYSEHQLELIAYALLKLWIERVEQELI